jgi:hypothetical protein
MNQQIEDDLRTAFSRHASGIPAEVSEKLRSIDYHPRNHRISPRLTIGALTGAAATAAAVVSIVVLGGAPAAFAGWTPSPTPAVGGQTATADSNCQAQLAELPNTSTGGGWNAITTDVRGPYSLVVYQDDSATASCFTGPALTIVSSTSGNGVANANTAVESAGQTSGASFSSTMIGTNGSGSLEHMSVAHLDSTAQGAFTVVEGQVASDVTGVTLVRSDGVDVQTTTGNGWFVAWWPGSEDVTSAEITTPGGVTTQTLNTPAPQPVSGSGS